MLLKRAVCQSVRLGCAFATLLLLPMATSAQPILHGPDCLHSGPTDSADVTYSDSMCSGDALGYANDRAVQAMITQLNLIDVRIKFRACTEEKFSASADKELSKYTATVKYPLTTDQKATSAHLAPLAHELSHILQIRQAGSKQDLLKYLELPKVELAADFLAGYILSRIAVGVDVTEYVANLALVGGYFITSHGSPLDRTHAFRLGFFYEKEQSVDRLHLEFHSHIWPQMGG